MRRTPLPSGHDFAATAAARRHAHTGTASCALPRHRFGPGSGGRTPQGAWPGRAPLRPGGQDGRFVFPCPLPVVIPASATSPRPANASPAPAGSVRFARPTARHHDAVARYEDAPGLPVLARRQGGGRRPRGIRRCPDRTAGRGRGTGPSSVRQTGAGEQPPSRRFPCPCVMESRETRRSAVAYRPACRCARSWRSVASAAPPCVPRRGDHWVAAITDTKMKPAVTAHSSKVPMVASTRMGRE